MKNTISRYPLISFFIMAVLFSWIAVTPLLLNPELPLEPFQILGAFAGPTLSAAIIIAVLEGRTGLGAFLSGRSLAGAVLHCRACKSNTALSLAPSFWV